MKKRKILHLLFLLSATMSIDFSNFATSGTKSGISDKEFKDIALGDKSNWTLASSIAGVWNLILGVNLVVPVASFEASCKQNSGLS